MRALLLLLLGLLIGAAGFHLFYLRLSVPERCGWDHPLDAEARANCRSGGVAAKREAEGRRQLDALIDRIDR